MEARQQELLAALAAQKQRNDANELDLRQARDRVVAQQQFLSAVQAQLQQSASAAGSSPQQQLLAALGHQTVDTRTLGKPQNFSGRRGQWRQFRFVFQAFASAAHPSMPDLFKNAESMGSVPV